MHLPTMQSLDVEHAALHATIKTILEAKANDDQEKIEAGFEQLDRLSHHVVEKLNQLEREVANHRQQRGNHSTLSNIPTKKVKTIAHQCDHC